MENPQDVGDAIAQWCFNAQGDTLIQTLAGEGERGQVLVAAAFLENLLTDCLLAKFKQHKTPSKAIDALLGISGKWAPVGDFAAKLNLCRALGVITDESRDALDDVRQIRNRFAHSDFKIRMEDIPLPSKLQNASDETSGCAKALGRLKSYLKNQEVLAKCVHPEGTPATNPDGTPIVAWQWILGSNKTTTDMTSNHHQFLGAVVFLFIRLLVNRHAIDGHPGEFKVHV